MNQNQTTHDQTTEFKVLSERRDGKYVVIYDVAVDNLTILGIRIEEIPPHGAKVIFPTIALTDNESKIEAALLWDYYGLDDLA